MAINILKKSHLNKITEMKLILVTEGEIINIMKSVKPKNSAGYDYNSSTFVKHSVWWTPLTSPPI